MTHNCLGAAFSRSDNDAGSIFVVKNVDEYGDNRDKVPSVISLHSLHHTEEWDYRVREDVESASWFKLRMGRRANWVPQDDPLLAQSLGKRMLNIPEGETADSLGEKYRRHLLKHAMHYIDQRLTTGLIDTISKHYVFVAPADWGHLTLM